VDAAGVTASGVNTLIAHYPKDEPGFVRVEPWRTSTYYSSGEATAVEGDLEKDGQIRREMDRLTGYLVCSLLLVEQYQGPYRCSVWFGQRSVNAGSKDRVHCLHEGLATDQFGRQGLHGVGFVSGELEFRLDTRGWVENRRSLPAIAGSTSRHQVGEGPQIEIRWQAELAQHCRKFVGAIQ
jgi:hypothetical protein